jgi:hypothetical protein
MDFMDFMDLINIQIIRSFIGSLSIIGSLLCMWYCMYKYAVCQDKKNHVHPEVDQSLKIKNNRNQSIPY